MFTFELEPRFVDCDGLGHISHTILPIWFEEARRPIFETFNPTLSLKTWNLILKQFQVEISHQIWHGSPVRIETVLEHLGNSSLVVVQRLFQSEKHVADGRTVLIHFDYGTQRPAPIPDGIRRQLEPHLVQK